MKQGSDFLRRYSGEIIPKPQLKKLRFELVEIFTPKLNKLELSPLSKPKRTQIVKEEAKKTESLRGRKNLEGPKDHLPHLAGVETSDQLRFGI